MKKLLFTGLAVVLLATAGFVPAQQGNAGVIAIAASGKNLSASFSNQAGGVRFFFLLTGKAPSWGL